MTKSVPSLSMIAAMAKNRAIGIDNRLPWHLPADLQHFKRLTLGKPILMGRLTWESLPGLLPQRPHLVVTRNAEYQAPGARVATSVEQALAMVSDVPEVMVVGGAQLYRAMLPKVDRIYLTEVDVEVAGDAFFPELNPDEWIEVERESHAADEKNRYDYSFVTYQRRA